MASQNQFLEHAGVEYPLIGGAMYPCSNPELVAAISEAGGLGIVQPLSLVYVHGYEFAAGLRYIKSLTSKPIGLNVIVEKSSRIYLDRMYRWLDEALQEGVRFFITALGDPAYVVQRVQSAGGVVYHDVTERKFATKALKSGVNGLICVNNQAGGHAGTKSPQELYAELRDLNVPLIAAGGVSDRAGFQQLLNLGYAGVQLGTRFIASEECTAHADYKQAILKAEAADIVMSERITGVPVAIIATEQVRAQGTKASWLAKILLRHQRTKHWVRSWYSLRSIYTLKRSAMEGASHKDYYQAGKSVAGIHAILSVRQIIQNLVGRA